MIRLDDIDQTLVARINSMIWLGRYHRRSVGYYRDAGMALQELRLDRTKELWASIVTEHCQISITRAYELIQLAKGRSLKELRAETSARVRKHRKDKWLPTKAPHQKGSKSHIASATGENNGPNTQVRLSRRRHPPPR